MPHHFSHGSHSGHGLSLVGLIILGVLAAGRWLKQKLWPANDDGEDRAMM